MPSSKNCTVTKMISDIFASGTIYLIRTSVNGNCGIKSLYGRLLVGFNGIAIDPRSGEFYAIFTTANQKMLLILHVDDYGVDLTKRRLHNGKFRKILSDTEKAITLTRQQLKRLVLDGTYIESWQNHNLQVLMEKFQQADPLPKKAST